MTLRLLPLLLLLSQPLGAQPPPATSESAAPEALATSRTWPLTVGIQALVGGELQQPRGTPMAFGLLGELLWRARIGAFAGLLSSSGTPLLPVTLDGITQPSLGDRVSVPFGLAARPFSALAQRRAPGDFAARLLNGVGVQLGLTVEHVRTSLQADTGVGLHLGAGLELPLFGGPVEGGVTLKLYGRLMVTPEVSLPRVLPDQPLPTDRVFAPAVNGQIFSGICYYP